MGILLLLMAIGQYETTGVYAAPTCTCVNCPCRRAADAPVVKPSAEALKIQVTLWAYPGCVPCATLKANIGAGDADFKVTEKIEAGPNFTHANYPVLTAQGRQPLVGVQSKTAVRKWLGLK